MDVYVKYVGAIEQPINAIVANQRPFFMTEEEVGEMIYYRGQYGYDGECWEANIMEQIRENKYGWFDLSKSLIDIGAGAGEYPIFSGFVHSYAFEPNRKKQCLIYANMLSFDRMDDIDVFPYAISDNPGVRKFNGWSEYLNNFNSFRNDKHLDKGIVQMEYRTLDSFNLDNIGLIKVDIEGFEYNALHSGIGTIIRNNYPPLLVEMWNDDDIRRWFDKQGMSEFFLENKRKLLKLLDDLGYVRINNQFGDWETFFFIHKDQLNGYIN